MSASIVTPAPATDISRWDDDGGAPAYEQADRRRTLDDFLLDNPPAGDGVSIIAPRGMRDY